MGFGEDILENRRAVYAMARSIHPERWSRSTRLWKTPSEVWLNPDETSNHQQAGNDTTLRLFLFEQAK